jgi:hypothetical protein
MGFGLAFLVLGFGMGGDGIMAKYSKEQRPPPTPKKRNPWDTPGFPDDGDAKPDMTYAAVGRALSQWEKFESELAELFAVFAGGVPTSLPAVRAYGSIQTFRGRADMIEAAAEGFFAVFPDDDLATRINDFMIRARNFSPRRNDIAHGVVHTAVWPSGQKGSGLFPAKYATKKNTLQVPFDPAAKGQRLTYAYTSAEIDSMRQQFQALEDDVNSLWFEAGVHRQTEMRNAEDRKKAEKARQKP